MNTHSFIILIPSALIKMEESTSLDCNLGIVATLNDETILEIIESTVISLPLLLNGAGELSFVRVRVLRSLSSLHGLQSLVLDHFLRSLEETFEKIGVSKFWRHFYAYGKVAVQEKNKPPIFDDEVHQLLCKALEEMCIEKQYQEKCLSMLVHVMQSYEEYSLEGKHVSDSERGHLFAKYE